MNYVQRQHLTKGQTLKAAVKKSHAVPYPSAETLYDNANRGTTWLEFVVELDLPDSDELRDVVAALLATGNRMSDLRLLYKKEKAYDHALEDLWNALYEVRFHFDPDREISLWENVFDGFPDKGFKCPPFQSHPEHLEMDHNRLAVLQQKEMAFEKLVQFLKDKGHPDLVTQFRDHLQREVQAGNFPEKPVRFLDNPSLL